MNVVDFAEGILGIDQSSSPVVAKCLRIIACNERPSIASDLTLVASQLEYGKRVDISLIRNIGESRLFQAKQLFINS